MSLQLYNTASRRKEPLVPHQEGRVRMYVCGPTIYDLSHIGHARSYVAFDVLRRYLAYCGHEVLYVQNFSDIDEKITKRARAEGIEPRELATRYIQEYFADMDGLGIMRASVHPRVTDHIPEVIEAVQELLRQGLAYAVEGNVYFDAKKAGGYGALTHHSLEAITVPDVPDIPTLKRDYLDFALWLRSGEGDVAWDSPWGRGKPGWHVECYVMSKKYLGHPIEIQGGGLDLIFPHHESSGLICQALTGAPFATLYVHNGLLLQNARKMSKSAKNFLTVREILQRCEGEALRFFTLLTHYRAPLEYTVTEFRAAERRLGGLQATVEQLRERASGVAPAGSRDARLLALANECREIFRCALDDDLDTPQAIRALEALSAEADAALSRPGELSASAAQSILGVFEELGGILGLFLRFKEPPHPSPSSRG